MSGLLSSSCQTAPRRRAAVATGRGLDREGSWQPAVSVSSRPKSHGRPSIRADRRRSVAPSGVRSVSKLGKLVRRRAPSFERSGLRPGEMLRAVSHQFPSPSVTLRAPPASPASRRYAGFSFVPPAPPRARGSVTTRSAACAPRRRCPPCAPGKRVITSEDLPTVGASPAVDSILCGDFMRLHAGLRAGPHRPEILIRDEVTTKGKTLLYISQRFGGRLTDNDGIKALRA